MFKTFRLKRPIGPDSVMDRDDVLTTKRALNVLGYLETPDYGLTPYPDAPMIRAVKGFQRRHRLRVDGVINPDGPTLRKINDAISARRAKLFGWISSAEPTSPIGSSAPSPEEKPLTRRLDSIPTATTGLAGTGERPPKKPKGGVKTAAAGAAIPAIAGGIPGIVSAIAGMLGLTLPLQGDTQTDDERERRCTEQYEEDTEICGQIRAKYGPRAAHRCWESANLRYGNCLAGRPVPELDKGTD